MKEIGGYLEFENSTGYEFYGDLIALNSGRNALLYLLQAKKIHKLLIPYFLCDSVWKICEKHSIEYEFYHINDQFKPLCDIELGKNEYIYIVNYYGLISDIEQMELKNKYINIIWDNAQAFFRRPLEGIDTIYTCRKYFGVPDGAYLSSSVKLKEKLLEDKSCERMIHLLGRYEGTGSQYYNNYRENEELIDKLPLRQMSKITHNLLRMIDYSEVINRREKNFEYISSLLKESNILKFDKIIAPFAYPYYTKDGKKIREQLIKNRVYIPILWMDVQEKANEVEKEYINNILPLPCDHRYGVEDMEKICSIIL